MSPGAIALTAILVLGAHDAAIVGVLGWLLYRQRILLAASPKPQPQKQAADEQDKPVNLSERRPA